MAWIVYRWVGLALLRRTWLNLESVWAASFVVAGVAGLVPGVVLAGRGVVVAPLAGAGTPDTELYASTTGLVISNAGPESTTGP